MATKIISKKCTDCKQIKPFSKYSKSKKGKYGLRAACKQCRNKQSRDWYNNGGGADKVRRYRQTENCKTNREKYRRNRGKEYYHNCYKQNPNQFKAYHAIQKAIKNGDILSPKLLKCTYCKKQSAMYHHASYEQEQWLIVIPVCGLCHSTIHKKLFYG